MALKIDGYLYMKYIKVKYVLQEFKEIIYNKEFKEFQ